MANYHIMLAADLNFIQYLFVTCQSILDSLVKTEHDATDHITFHVVTPGESTYLVAKTMAYAFSEDNAKVAVPFSFECYAINEEMFKDFIAMKINDRQSFGTYYRFVIGSILPKDIEKILYLDVDILLYKDIRQMFQIYPLGDKLFATVTTPVAYLISDINERDFSKEPLSITLKRKDGAPSSGIIPCTGYFNAGVILINLKLWRELDVETQLFDITRQYIPFAHDQDMLNLIGIGRTIFMDWAWNMSFGINRMFINRGIDLKCGHVKIEDLPPMAGSPKPEHMEQKISHPFLIHFTECKPWSGEFTKAYGEDIAEKMSAWTKHRERWFLTFKKLVPTIQYANELINRMMK